MIFSESNSNISAALAKAWSAIQTPKHNATVNVKTKRGGTYKFEYTDLNGILDAVRPIFINNKLSIMQNSYSTVESNLTMACVETIFLHESGEYVKSYPLKFPAAQSMQDFGGQITYMKRYSLAAMLGIATEKDDDANGASGNDYQYMNQQQKQNNYPQQQTQTNQQGDQNQGSKAVNTEQYNHLIKVVSEVANTFNADGMAFFNGALQQCRIPDKHPKYLTEREAAMVINYVLNLKPPQAQ
ncbi:ERF family protein [Lysinibacillus sp. NPDC094403]|uniref:ERF family protein n=1 Tax=Lysinibacillus sp. NPDC094403 TaxID=3390581 RepID=UPI003CFDAC41